MRGTRKPRLRAEPEPSPGATHELLAHTAEVRVRVRAPDFTGMAAEAGRVLAELELGRQPPAARGRWREITVRAGDRGALLVDWLNELIFLAESERWVATEFRAGTGGGDGELRMRARGVRVDVAPSRVKAATHHGLEVRVSGGGLEAEVVFDV